MSAVAVSPPANKINPKWVVPFVNAIGKVLSTMVGVKTIVRHPRLKNDVAASYDVSAIVALGGEATGTLVLKLDGATAVGLVEAFSGVRFEMDHPDFADAVAELANMIAGDAKKDLPGYVSVKRPSVVIGPDHLIAGPKNAPCVVIPCSTAVGEFTVEVNAQAA